jgi:hypothetical protein
MWKKINEWIFKYFCSIFMEQTNKEYKLSLGRVSFIVLFIVSIIIWSTNRSIPPDMLNFMIIISGYIFGTKGIELVKSYLESKKSDSSSE